MILFSQQKMQDFKKVLTRDYNFLEQNTFILTDPTREELLNQLDMLSGLVAANDSLLIFYAGHGFWDEKFEQGCTGCQATQNLMHGGFLD